MSFFQRLRKMPVADVSLTLSIGFFAYAILLLIVGILLAQWMDFDRTMLPLCGVWQGTVILFIWNSGKAGEKQGRVMNLGVLHFLPLLMLVCSIPHFTNWSEISYLLGFLEVLICGALVIYGLICIRILVLPPWQYWSYLALNGVSLWILFSRS